MGIEKKRRKDKAKNKYVSNAETVSRKSANGAVLAAPPLQFKRNTHLPIQLKETKRKSSSSGIKKIKSLMGLFGKANSFITNNNEKRAYNPLRNAPNNNPIDSKAIGKYKNASNKNDATKKRYGENSTYTKVMKALNVTLSYQANRNNGKSRGQSAAGAISKQIAKDKFSKVPVPKSISRATKVSKTLSLIGAPEEAKEAIDIAVAATPQSMAINGGVLATETAYNLVTGDQEALEKQNQDLKDGKNPALIPFAGWNMLSESLIGDWTKLYSLASPEAKTGDKGLTTAAGNYIGESLHDFISGQINVDSSDLTDTDLLKEAAKLWFDDASNAFYQAKNGIKNNIKEKYNTASNTTYDSISYWDNVINGKIDYGKDALDSIEFIWNGTDGEGGVKGNVKDAFNNASTALANGAHKLINPESYKKFKESEKTNKELNHLTKQKVSGQITTSQYKNDWKRQNYNDKSRPKAFKGNYDKKMKAEIAKKNKGENNNLAQIKWTYVKQSDTERAAWLEKVKGHHIRKNKGNKEQGLKDFAAYKKRLDAINLPDI